MMWNVSFHPITISNGLIDSTINMSNDLRICLPQNSTIKWAESGSINVNPTKLTFNSISEDSTQLVFHVDSLFTASESVVISGLKVTGFDSTMSLHKIRVIADGLANYDSANAQDTFGYWVGVPAIQVNPNRPADNYLIVNSINPDSVWHSKVVVKNGPIDSTFHKGNTLRIKIPNDLNMEWAGEPSSYDTSMFSLVSISDKVLELEIREDFSAGSNDTIEVAFDSLESSYFHSLFLDVVGTDAGGIGPTYPDSTYEKITISNPTIASDTSQVFVVGDYPQPLKPIRYMEDGISPTLKGRPYIYLKIPDEMHIFLTGDSFQVTDQDSNSIPIISFELLESRTVLYIEFDSTYIDTNWTKHDTVVVRNLKIDGFDNPTNGPTFLQASVLNDSVYHDQDTASIKVGRPKLELTQNHTFLYNDVPRPLNEIIIHEDPLVSTITKAEGILLMLPEGFPGKWVIPEDWIIPDSLDTNGSSYTGTIDSLVIIGSDTLELFLSQDFNPGDFLIIHNLMVGNFLDTSYQTNSLELSVNMATKNFPYFDDDTTSWLKIGRPEIEMDGGLVILFGNDNPVPVPPITIYEDASAPVIIKDRGFITLTLPETTGIEWNRSIPIITLGGNDSSIFKVSQEPDYVGRFVKFAIMEDFLGEDTITIHGLYLNPPSNYKSASLLLSLNAGASVCNSSASKILVSRLTFSSEGDQFFFKNSENSNDRQLNGITIIQDTTLPLINDRLILEIPECLKAKWDTINPIAVYLNGGINSIEIDTIKYSPSLKKIHLIDSSFSGAGSIEINGLFFQGLYTTLLDISSEGSLRLMLDDLTYSFVVTDTTRKLIGGPSIYSIDSSSFVLGDKGKFAKVDTIIIKEDDSVAVLPEFDILRIIIPNDAPSFSWDITSTVIMDSDTIVVNYQNNNKIATIPLEALDSIDIGDLMKLWGLGFNTIVEEDPGFNLEFQLVKEGNGPTIRDAAAISSGSLTIGLENSISHPLGSSLINDSSLIYKLPKITVKEDTTNLLGEKRSLWLRLSDSLAPIANWTPDNKLNNGEIKSISVTGDTLKIFFQKQLTNNEITLSGLKLTTREIYGVSGEIQADSLADYFSTNSGGIEISTQRLEVGYNRMILDSTKKTIAFYPPVILEKPEIYYSQEDTNTIISFVTSPGMFHPDSVFSPSLFQIVRTPWLTNDTTLFSDSSNSIVSIVKTNWSPIDRISVSGMPFVKISLSEEDLVKLNVWFDEMHYYDYDDDFYHFMNVDKTTLPFDQNSDIVARKTDSSSIAWLHYNPELISFSKKERIVSNNELNKFVLNFGDVFPESIQIKLSGGITNIDTTISLNNIDSTFSLSTFPELKNDLYTLRITSLDTSEKNMVPIIRQFIVDNNPPELVDILPRTGKSKSGGGHEVSKLDSIVLFYQESLSIERDSLNYLIQFHYSNKLLKSEFPFPDSLELNLKIEWSNDLSFSNSDSSSLLITRTLNDIDTLNWSMMLDNLLLSLLKEDTTRIETLERINARLIFTLSDYTSELNSDTMEYVILLNIDRVVGEEVFNYPNPFSVVASQKTRVRYVINNTSQNKGIFTVFDAGGDVVYYNNKVDVSMGTHYNDLTWDGKDFKREQTFFWDLLWFS